MASTVTGVTHDGDRGTQLHKGIFRGTRIVAGVTTLLLVVGVVSAAVAPEPASAASGSDFDAGNIITDANFHNTTSMSIAQVQSFLNSQVRSCTAGYTCLSNYAQATYNKAATNQCDAYIGASNESAAAIIVRASTACGLNPQVMLVTLQKEQALITARSPSPYAINHATGYGCPDTAACNPAFSGFFDQVYGAAAQFSYYDKHPTSYRYQAKKVINILYNPNYSCGTTPVYIQNQATANLYIYTPYAPNAAALANLYGTGDGCSAYGNRNFWRIYNDWFGSPSGPKLTNGSLDFARGVAGGFQVTGWAVDPYNATSGYVWVNVDGKGGPISATLPLSWIQGLYPGLGINHGYDSVVSASPGKHTVCVLQLNGTTLGCNTVTVPTTTHSDGRLTDVSTAVGTISVTGWSLDTAASIPNYVWVNVDGTGAGYRVDKVITSTLAAYPLSGTMTGFAVNVPASVGRHEVCVYGGEAALLGCESVTVPFAEDGQIQAVTGVLGGATVAGWSLDQLTPAAATYVWLTVDGVGSAALANLASPTAAITAYPEAKYGNSHGFLATVKASPGVHTICVWGTSENRSYGCKSVTVPNYEVGHLDSVTGTYGSITASGWSLDQRTNDSTYVWMTVDGAGSASRANLPLNWVDAMYHRGANHGFTATVKSVTGTHTACVWGTSETVSYGCSSVVVPSPVAGSFDTAAGAAAVPESAGIAAVPSGIRITGWTADRFTTSSLYVWVTVDGVGGPIRASNFLNWINGYFPGVGDYHGFDSVIAATSGTHTICAIVTEDNVSLGCKTVVVP